jgi:hypothetical protein
MDSIGYLLISKYCQSYLVAVYCDSGAYPSESHPLSRPMSRTLHQRRLATGVSGGLDKYLQAVV